MYLLFTRFPLFSLMILNYLLSIFCYQLQKLKVEPVLLHYFSCLKVLQGTVSWHPPLSLIFRPLISLSPICGRIKMCAGQELRIATSTRLKTSLYSFTSPGGPMYPTRAVRHAAWDALNFHFPVRLYTLHVHLMCWLNLFLLILTGLLNPLFTNLFFSNLILWCELVRVPWLLRYSYPHVFLLPGHCP